eukprot:5939494-Prymnesium_polylepis.3
MAVVPRAAVDQRRVERRARQGLDADDVVLAGARQRAPLHIPPRHTAGRSAHLLSAAENLRRTHLHFGLTTAVGTVRVWHVRLAQVSMLVVDDPKAEATAEAKAEASNTSTSTADASLAKPKGEATAETSKAEAKATTVAQLPGATLSRAAAREAKAETMAAFTTPWDSTVASGQAAALRGQAATLRGYRALSSLHTHNPCEAQGGQSGASR